MAVTSAHREGATVKVRLSDIKPELRQQAADILERQWKRVGVGAFDLLRLHLAAADAIPDAVLEVPEWKAHRVLVDGQRPPGPTPIYSPPQARTTVDDEP